MRAAAKFPTTYEELTEMGKQFASFPASWDEYIDVLESSELTLEFHENQIYAMGYTSDNHSILAQAILILFKTN